MSMAKDGNKIPNLSVECVRELLADEHDPKAIKRLTIAREYLARLPPEGIEEKYGWPRQTVYNWLDPLEERKFEHALYDDERPRSVSISLSVSIVIYSDQTFTGRLFQARRYLNNRI